MYIKNNKLLNEESHFIWKKKNLKYIFWSLYILLKLQNIPFAKQ